MNESVEVIVRSKPAEERTTTTWRIQDGKTLKYDESEEFQVDAISSGETHEEFYAKHVSKWIADASRGYNVTIIAYGLPNSGKTYSMMGTAGQSRLKPEARGVIVRCFEDLIQLFQGDNKATTITGSYCHVFDDSRVADLLDTKKRNLPVEEKTEPGSAVYFIKGCTQQVLTTTNDVVRLIEKANLMRNATGAVQQRSEKKLTIKQSTTVGGIGSYRPHRSHAVFQYTIEHVENINDDNTNAIISSITIIDLAGHNIQAYFSAESDCSDVGLHALHSMLDKLSTSKTEDYNEALLLCKSTSLTCLLCSSLFGKSKCVVISTLPMNSTDAAKHSLQLVLSFKNSRSHSTPPCLVLVAVTNIGRIIAEMRTAKISLTEKCTGSKDASVSLEILNYSSIKIDNKVYDDLDQESLDLLQKYLDLKGSLLINKRTQLAAKSQQSEESTIITLPSTVHSPTLCPLINSKVPVQLHPVSSSMPGLPNTAAIAGSLLLPVLKPQNSLTLHSTQTTKSPIIVTPSTNKGQVMPNIAKSPVKPALSLQLKRPSVVESSNNKEDLSNSDTDDDRQQSKHHPPVPDRSSPPPPLNDIPHILPLPITSTPRTSYSLLLPPPNSVDIATVNSSSDQVTEKRAATIKVEDNANETTFKIEKLSSLPPTVLSSSSSCSTNGSHSIRGPSTSGERKKKMRKRRSSRDYKKMSPLKTDNSNRPVSSSSSLIKRIPVKLMNDSSSESEEDAFDPDFKPGRLTMAPQYALPLISQRSNQIPSEWMYTDTSGCIASDQPLENGHHHSLPGDRPLYSLPGDRPLHSLPGDRPLHSLPVNSPLVLANNSGNRQIVPPLQSQLQTHQLPLYGSAHLPPLLYNSSSEPLKSQLPKQKELSTQIYNEELSSVLQERENISDKEIHVAARECVKRSYMKQLVMKYGVDYVDEWNRTPLMYAVLGNQPSMCEVLLNCNADIDAIDRSGNTALLWATLQAKPEIMKILLKFGANVCKCDNDGHSVFHWSMRTPNIQCLKILCKYTSLGIENKPDKDCMTPLHFAVSSELPNHIKLFLKSLPNVNVNPEDTGGRTPLNYAVMNSSPICIQSLIDSRGPEAVKHKDDKGRTALHYACAKNSADCIRAILSSKCCDLHVTDYKGTTPLHWAAASNQMGIVQLLLRRGADRGQTDNNNMTPLDYAVQRNHQECVEILKTYGLQRPSSAWSIASQFSIRPPTPPTLDRMGHVPFKIPAADRHVSSIDRLPADGHSNTDEYSNIQDRSLLNEQQKDEADSNRQQNGDILEQQDTSNDTDQNSETVKQPQTNHSLIVQSTDTPQLMDDESSLSSDGRANSNQSTTNCFLQLIQFCMRRNNNAIVPAET